VARIESLILGKTMDDAIARAKAYIAAGVDGIMIHSKSKDPVEILEFAKLYASFDKTVPLIAVPTTYNVITWTELKAAGINLVIYANHLLRSAYPAMETTAQSILKHGRSKEADDTILPVQSLLKLIPNNYDPS
jgi:phosphoenolpyruvate phosphomutase